MKPMRDMETKMKNLWNEVKTNDFWFAIIMFMVGLVVLTITVFH